MVSDALLLRGDLVGAEVGQFIGERPRGHVLGVVFVDHGDEIRRSPGVLRAETAVIPPVSLPVQADCVFAQLPGPRGLVSLAVRSVCRLRDDPTVREMARLVLVELPVGSIGVRPLEGSGLIAGRSLH